MSKRIKMLEAEQEQEMRALLGPDAKIETYGESVSSEQLSAAEQWKNEIYNNVTVFVDPDGVEIVLFEELVKFLAEKFGGVA